MKKLRNTLFVLSEDAYLTLDGENVVLLNFCGNHRFTLFQIIL